MNDRDLDALHEMVKKLDALLSKRETGLASWWIILGALLGQIERISNGNE